MGRIRTPEPGAPGRSLDQIFKFGAFWHLLFGHLLRRRFRTIKLKARFSSLLQQEGQLRQSVLSEAVRPDRFAHGRICGEAAPGELGPRSALP